MSKRAAEGPHRTKEEGLEMSSIGGEAPKRATAAQMASRAIKSAKGRRPRGGAPSSTSSHSATPFGNIDPNIGPPAGSQPQQPFLSNGFAFGQSQSFPPANPTPAQPAQNGTSLSFGGAGNTSSFNFSSNFSSGPAPSNPFSNISTSQSAPEGSFQGFQGSLFNLPAPSQNNQGVNGNTAHNASAFGFNNNNNMSSAPSSNPLFGASQTNTTSSTGFLGQSATQSAAPSGGLFGQNDSKPSLFGQQQPSTPSSSKTPLLGASGGSTDAMQTTPDGSSRAEAPKAALFGMPAQSNPPFGSIAPSTSGGTSIFSNLQPQGAKFTSFGAESSSEAFPSRPTEPTTSGGSSLFGRVSKPLEQGTQATASNAQNAPSPATATDAGTPTTSGANLFPSAQPTTTGNVSQKSTDANVFPSFKPSGTSTSTSAPPIKITGENMFSPSFKPVDQQALAADKSGQPNAFSKFTPIEPKRTPSPPPKRKPPPKLNGGNMFTVKPIPQEEPHPEQTPEANTSNTQPRNFGYNMLTVKSESTGEPTYASTRYIIPGKTTSANEVFPTFDFTVSPTPTSDAAAAKTTGSNIFPSAFKPTAPAADSAPAKTPADSVFSPAFKPSFPGSTQASTGSSFFANSTQPAASGNLFSPKPSAAFGTSTSASAADTSGSLFAKPASGTLGAQAPATTPGTSFFGTSNASSAAAAAPTVTAPAATPLFGAPSASSATSSQPPSLFSAAPGPSQPTSGSSNIFSATASDINKKGSEAPAPTSTTAQAQPLDSQPGTTPSLFSSTPAFGGATGGNIFAPKAVTQSTSAPDASSENEAQVPSASLPESSSQSVAPTSVSAAPSLFEQTPKASTTTAPAIAAPKTALFGEASKTTTTTATSSAPTLFDSSKTAPSAGSVFGKQTLFSDSAKPAAPAPSSSAKPPLFSSGATTSDTGKLSAKPKPTAPDNATDTSQGKNDTFTAQNKVAPPASATEQLPSTTAAASTQGALQIKGKGAEQSEVSSYGPPSIPENLSKEQKLQYDKLFRVRSLNHSFKKKIAEMDPDAGDFISLIKYYVRVRDAIGSPTGLVNESGLKRTGDSLDEEADNTPKRAKPNTASGESVKGKEVANDQTISKPSNDVEMSGGGEAVGEPARKTSIVEPSSGAPVGVAASATKRKAEDDGEGRPNGSTTTQAGKRARNINVEGPQSMTSSLFASSFASSIGAGKKSVPGDSSLSQKEEQTVQESNIGANESKTGSDEARQDNGDKTAASTNGKSLFDRIQYDDNGQAKRASAEEESSEQGGSKALSELLGGSKYASSFNPPGTPSPPPPFKNNFDFAKAGAMAASKSEQGRSSPLSNQVSANQTADSPKPAGTSSASPAPSIFASSLSGSKSGPADNTWKNDSPIKFAASKPTEPSSSGAAEGTSGSAAAPSSSAQYPALFGGSSQSTGPQTSLGSSTPQAGFGFAGSNPANFAAQKFSLSAGNSADPSRSTTPGVTSDTTGPEESGGEGNDTQVDLTRSGAGEENEDPLMEMRANAFKLKKGEGWKKQGVGPLRVLKHKTNGRSRVILRADPSGKVVLNVALQEKHPYTPCKDSVQLLVPDTEGNLEQWALRVKTAENANNLAKVMTENQNKS